MNLHRSEFNFRIDCDDENGGKVLLNENDVEVATLLERVSNRKADSYVKLSPLRARVFVIVKKRYILLLFVLKYRNMLLKYRRNGSIVE